MSGEEAPAGWAAGAGGVAQTSEPAHRHGSADRVDLPAIARAYLGAGFALVPIATGSKGPRARGWNRRDRAITSADQLHRIRAGVGLAHRWSTPPTCAIDVDALDGARAWLAEHGIDLDALLEADDAVHIDSSRAGRAKLIYQLAEPLPTRRITDGDGQVLFELRCSDAGGLTVQDCLPPTVHPGTGLPYRWAGRGHWQRLPTLPEQVLTLWRELGAPAGNGAERSAGPEHASAAQLEQLRDALACLDPDPRDTWVKVAHHLRRLGDAGRAVWDNWAERSDKFDPREQDRVWSSITASASSYRAVFALAKAAGWDNPGPPLADADEFEALDARLTVEDFVAYLPDHTYVCLATSEHWPAASVNASLPKQRVPGADEKQAKKIPAARWLDVHRAVHQLTWMPGQPQLIDDAIVDEGGGFVRRAGFRVLNQYRPPQPLDGDPAAAAPWIDLLHTLFHDHAEHVLDWLAHRVQRPGAKVNHALVLGGAQGIGKDTLLEPLRHAVGPWNFTEAAPTDLLGQFNGFVRAVVLRISEARDLGEASMLALYERTKTLIASPPNILMCNLKYRQPFQVANVAGVIITTNHRTGSLFLPPDDRRHFVVWSDAKPGSFDDSYFDALWRWLLQGGIGHVGAHLRARDISAFDPAAPPPRTDAWHALVHATRSPDEDALRAALELLGDPEALVLDDLRTVAEGDLFDLMTDRRHRRRIPHLLEAVGYVVVRNAAAADGLWSTARGRTAVYVRADHPEQERVRIAESRTQARMAAPAGSEYLQ